MSLSLNDFKKAYGDKIKSYEKAAKALGVQNEETYVFNILKSTFGLETANEYLKYKNLINVNTPGIEKPEGYPGVIAKTTLPLTGILIVLIIIYMVTKK